jgi:hypothetical protein
MSSKKATITFKETQQKPIRSNTTSNNIINEAAADFKLVASKSYLNYSSELKLISTKQLNLEHQLTSLTELLVLTHNSVNEVKDKLSQYDIDGGDSDGSQMSDSELTVNNNE